MYFDLIAQGSAWIDLSTVWSIARVVLGLGFVIFVHELGHFLVAKMCGVKCEKFYVGFDFFDIKIGDIVLLPRALLKWQWGETEYGIGVIPLGGYVKMLGQEDNPSSMEAENLRDAGDVDAGLRGGPIDREQLDPRSFRAKSVLQRMAIISAGVVFNLIFAVIFAAIAFKSGVNYSPAIAGTPIPGGPAWEANMDGATIVRIGEKRFDEGYAPFIDVAQEVALHGSDEPLEVEFIAPGSTESQIVKVAPRKQLRRGLDFGTLGINPEQQSTLSAANPAMPGQSSAKANPPFAANDQIVALNGSPVSRLIDLKQLLATVVDEDVTFTVKREGADTKNTETLDIVVPPNPIHELGFSLQYGPIASLRNGSPAQQAGLQVGDKIISMNNEPLGDLQTFDQRLLQQIKAGTTKITLQIERTDGNNQTQSMSVDVTPIVPTSSGAFDYGPYALETLGLAVPILPIVAGVVPGSQAAEVGLVPGDAITAVEILLSDEQKKDTMYANIQSTVTISESETQIGELIGIVQQIPSGTKYRLRLSRNGSENASVEIASRDSDQFFQPIRGIQLTPLEHVYTSNSWGDAFALGARQTRDDLLRIGKFLRNLVTGKMPATMIGGIGTIGAVATMEANEGTSRLLLFLTMLSANLAIINLLPIPVLDGGHLMFLAYEGILRRPVTEKVQIALSYLGLFFILGLMIFAIAMDVSRFVEWFS